MALYIMHLMRATSITRESGRASGPVNQDFSGPEVASSSNGEGHLGPKKVEISRALPRIKSITDRAVSIRGPYVVVCT
jgi:hypothetical protein